jgi:hypothetical protein
MLLLLNIEIMDILHKDEISCFFKWRVQFNIKLKNSPNILNLTLKFLTLNPYALHKFTMKEARMLGHFMSFSKHMPAYVKNYMCIGKIRPT